MNLSHHVYNNHAFIAPRNNIPAEVEKCRIEPNAKKHYKYHRIKYYLMYIQGDVKKIYKKYGKNKIYYSINMTIPVLGELKKQKVNTRFNWKKPNTANTELQTYTESYSHEQSVSFIGLKNPFRTIKIITIKIIFNDYIEYELSSYEHDQLLHTSLIKCKNIKDPDLNSYHYVSFPSRTNKIEYISRQLQRLI